MNTTIEDTIEVALSKVQKKHEKDLCRYLPGTSGGYLHHFSLKKLKKVNPEELRALINEFILETPTPRCIDPKPRARRSINQTFKLDQSTINSIINLALKNSDTDLLSTFRSNLSINQVKRDLIKSIKANQVDESLWNSYIEIIKLQ